MNKLMIAALALAAFCAAGAPAARAEDATASDKVFEADKGTDTINVSSYPKEQQENYKIFSEKCSKCHTLARPINSDYALPEEWTALALIECTGMRTPRGFAVAHAAQANARHVQSGPAEFHVFHGYRYPRSIAWHAIGSEVRTRSDARAQSLVPRENSSTTPRPHPAAFACCVRSKRLY